MADLSGIPNPQTPVTHQPGPEPAGDPALEAIAKQSIADLEKEFAYQEPVDEVPATQAAPSQEGTAASQTAETPAAGTQTPETKKEPTEAGLERLVAREVELRTREAALQAREAAIQAKEGQKDPSVAQLLQGVRTDPEGTLRQLGVDVDHMLRLTIAKRLGDKAPAELKNAVRDAEIQRELNELRSYNQQIQQQASAQAFYQQKVNEAKQYVTTEGSKNVTPEMSDLIKDSPDWVHEMVVEEITRDAQARIGKGGPDVLMSPADALKRVEKRLSPALSKRTASTATQPTGTTTNTKPAETPKTNPPPNNPKPTQAPKPLLPWQARDDQELMDAGIREALLEYRRSSGQ